MEKKLIGIFWNPEDRRLRAFWRLSLQGFVWLAAQIGLGLVMGLVVAVAAIVTNPGSLQNLQGSVEAMTDLLNHPVVTLFMQGLVLLVTLVTVWLGGRLLDRRRFADFGFHFSRRWWLDLAFGLFLGAFLMTCIFLAERAAGWISVSEVNFTTDPGMPFPLAVLIPLVLFVCVGISEELFFRGYQMKNMAEGMNSRRFGPAAAILAAAVFSSILFGFAHIANPNAGVISTLNIMAAGVFLALGYLFTGELALSIGLHITWNFFQGNVFGFPVSGLEPVAARFLLTRQAGPEWVTGGVFGPEGGLIGLGAMVLGSAMILLYVLVTRRKISPAAALAQSPKGNTASSE